jgi:hypothetical protein
MNKNIEEIKDLFLGFSNDFEIPNIIKDAIKEKLEKSPFLTMAESQIVAYQDFFNMEPTRSGILNFCENITNMFQKAIKQNENLKNIELPHKELIYDYVSNFKGLVEYFFDFADSYKSDNYFKYLAEMRKNIALMFFIYFGELFAVLGYEQFLNKFNVDVSIILDPRRLYVRHFIILSYAIVDYVLDDPSITPEEKNQHIKNIKNKLTGHGSSNLSAFDKSYDILTEHYPPLEHPMLYEGINYAFKIESGTVSDPSLEACILKGTTLNCYVIYSILTKVPITEYSPEIIRSMQIIGFISQILDDVIDLQSDIHEQNNTFVTEWYKKEGNIDGLMSKTLQTLITYITCHKLIMEMDYGFTKEQNNLCDIFVFISYCFCLYNVDGFSENFSTGYVDEVRKLIIPLTDNQKKLYKKYINSI